VVNGIFAEMEASTDAGTGAAIGDALVQLAEFTAADTVLVKGSVPGRWADGLRRHRAVTVQDTG
jgi:hypothetical protein